MTTYLHVLRPGEVTALVNKSNSCKVEAHGGEERGTRTRQVQKTEHGKCKISDWTTWRTQTNTASEEHFCNELNFNLFSRKQMNNYSFVIWMFSMFWICSETQQPENVTLDRSGSPVWNLWTACWEKWEETSVKWSICCTNPNICSSEFTKRSPHWEQTLLKASRVKLWMASLS